MKNWILVAAALLPLAAAAAADYDLNGDLSPDSISVGS